MGKKRILVPPPVKPVTETLMIPDVLRVSDATLPPLPLLMMPPKKKPQLRKKPQQWKKPQLRKKVVIEDVSKTKKRMRKRMMMHHSQVSAVTKTNAELKLMVLKSSAVLPNSLPVSLLPLPSLHHSELTMLLPSEQT